jgi:hypothetical protein
MKRFIIQISFFSGLSLSAILIILSSADGYTDPYYIRFTTPKQQNMILGTSRAAQGLQPKVFKQILKKDIHNFAFTVTQSPYGRVYYESIKLKHNKIKGGVFIVTVDPWSISSWCESPNDLEQFRENDLCLDNTKIVDSYPNYNYLLHNLSGKYSDIMINRISYPLHRRYPNLDLHVAYMYLHQDGWLEVSHIKMDSASVAERVAEKTQTHRNLLPQYQFSSVRLHYLVKTINYLNEYGNVFLLRLPIHNSMMEIEEEFMPDFDMKIKAAIDISQGYLDMTPQNSLFSYTDGNHLHQQSGEKVSMIIANWISETNKASTKKNESGK